MIKGISFLRSAGSSEAYERLASFFSALGLALGKGWQEEESRGEEVPKKRRVEFRRSAENLRKIFLAMARDLRVMVIKLADRLHNMQTLYAQPPEHQVKVARETMQIYAALAHRLGIWKIKWELEDLAFKYVEPKAYQD